MNKSFRNFVDIERMAQVYQWLKLDEADERLFRRQHPLKSALIKNV